MTVTGREMHNGIDAWAISLKPDARPAGLDALGLRRRRQAARAARSRPRRERAAAGHPLADLRGAARRAGEPLLTLTGAHPSARVVHDAARAETATRKQAKP